jgi:hypothetical protein
VQVVGEQCPREDGEPGPVDDLRQASNERGAIPVITKEQAPLDAPHHHVVQGPGGIEARAARHDRHGTTVTLLSLSKKRRNPNHSRT